VLLAQLIKALQVGMVLEVMALVAVAVQVAMVQMQQLRTSLVSAV
jgi:hypothetical protein